MALHRKATKALQLSAAFCAVSVAAYLSDIVGLAPASITTSTAWKSGRYVVLAVMLTLFTGLIYTVLRKISVRDLARFGSSLLDNIFDYVISIVGLGGVGVPYNILESQLALQKLRSRTINLSIESESKIIQLFEDALSSGLSDEISSALETIVEKKISNETHIRASEALNQVSARLDQAARTVSTRGFFNLAIGIVFAVTALFILKAAVSLFSPSQLAGLSIAQSLYVMGMRISLALVITLIAYFFLSLYRKSLDDVKYYQNELRMVGLKLASLNIAYDCEGSDARKIVIEH